MLGCRKVQLVTGFRRIHNPLGKVNQFQSGPSPELAYVIGVVLGDGNLNIHGYNAELILAVTDYDFAEEFSASLATILGRPKPYKVRWHPRKNRWIVSRIEYSPVQLSEL